MLPAVRKDRPHGPPALVRERHGSIDPNRSFSFGTPRFKDIIRPPTAHIESRVPVEPGAKGTFGSDCPRRVVNCASLRLLPRRCRARRRRARIGQRQPQPFAAAAAPAPVVGG